MLKKIILCICLLSLIICLITCGLLWQHQKKTGFIYIGKVYEGYKGKIQTEQEFKESANKQQVILDSLKMIIDDYESKSRLASGKSAEDLNAVLNIQYDNYDRLVKKFSEYNEIQSKKHMDKILKEVNLYVKDYGDSHGYDYIYGAVGDGSLMYANDKEDLTETILKYVNSRYESR